MSGWFPAVSKLPLVFAYWRNSVWWTWLAFCFQPRPTADRRLFFCRRNSWRGWRKSAPPSIRPPPWGTRSWPSATRTPSPPSSTGSPSSGPGSRRSVALRLRGGEGGDVETWGVNNAFPAEGPWGLCREKCVSGDHSSAYYLSCNLLFFKKLKSIRSSRRGAGS